MAPANPFAFGTDTWDPSHRFQTSWLVSPYVLFAVRALMSLYAFFTLLFEIGFQCAHPDLGGCAASRASFSYFTVLTYWGIAFYTAVAAAHTFAYARRGAAPLGSWPRPLQALHSLLYTTVVTYPFIVTVVFWGVLYYGGRLATPYQVWGNVSEHALNSAFALVEVLLPRTAPMPWLHILWLLVLLALYLALAYLTRATEGFYTYDFLDPELMGPYVAAYIFGIAVAAVVVFLVVWSLVWARMWLTERKLGMGGKFANVRGDRRGGDEEEQERYEMGSGSAVPIAQK
ncbi:hypothetical protein F5X99DRAFT_252456 [Biscogniauxia marginata]|nr:hypothetical protein F5X99DRAFT_252456 [Biscogniauxia marginata]